MIFAIEMDTKGLWAFESPESALSHCEDTDIEDGNWDFFDERGRALAPRRGEEHRFLGILFSPPRYNLTEEMLSGAMDLLDRLGEVRYVDCGPFSSIPDVRQYLEARRSDK